ncbi:hypothetical protein P5609_012165 [Bacillus licheniformis]|uniref:hypothetical protein n=1 Tax=Bacillus licheniformis TaxID=1402 RepID=UPI00018C8AE0|nr:hypothetical protein [Bacillus licheniformis]MBW7632644.1 hypothetical protein [Bacillus licheniformis]MED4408428.1 hypothetical protein [Bacillus licheniformis]QDL79978.1 hypothetical protein D9Y32_22435 [Bacillus licheniformis]
MKRVELPNEVGKALKELVETIGEEELYKFENLLCHYKHSNKYEKKTQKQIATIVDFVRDSEKNRVEYYAALTSGFSIKTEPKKEKRSDKETEENCKNEGLAIYIKGKMVWGIPSENLNSNLEALIDGRLLINWSSFKERTFFK